MIHMQYVLHVYRMCKKTNAYHMDAFQIFAGKNSLSVKQSALTLSHSLLVPSAKLCLILIASLVSVEIHQQAFACSDQDMLHFLCVNWFVLAKWCAC